jgi:hypothetical protein
MMSHHGVGRHNARGALSRMPRAVVGAVLGLVLVLVQGQSEASPFYQIQITPQFPLGGIFREAATPLMDSFAAAIDPFSSVAGAAAAGPAGVGVFSRSSVTVPPLGFASITASAYMEVSDVLLTSLPGTTAAPFIPVSLHAHLSGQLTRSIANGGFSIVHVDVILNNSIYSGEVSDSATGVEGFGLLSGYTGGTTLLTLPDILLPVNQAISLGLNLWAETEAGNGLTEADFLHTLSFPTVGSVFNLPGGYTVNSVDGLIHDNQFISEASSVPEPSTWLLLATGLTGLLGYGWRYRRQGT